MSRTRPGCVARTPLYHAEVLHARASRRVLSRLYRPWTVGDNMQFATGQGDLLATPLQLAVAYSALANGGRSYAAPGTRDRDPRAA